MPSFILKLWNQGEIEEEERGEKGDEEEEEEEEKSLWYIRSSVPRRAALQSTTVQKATGYGPAAQVKLRYSQEELKKSTERSRLAKSLLWFKQGTRPVAMSQDRGRRDPASAGDTAPPQGQIVSSTPRRHPENYYSFLLKEYIYLGIKSTLVKSLSFPLQTQSQGEVQKKGSV